MLTSSAMQTRFMFSVLCRCVYPVHKKSCEETFSPPFLTDGSVNAENSYVSVVIPDDLLKHNDNPFIETDINSENAILGFIYESGYETIVVYTSEEAEKYCDPFDDEPFSNIENLLESEVENLLESEIENPFQFFLQLLNLGS